MKSRHLSLFWLIIGALLLVVANGKWIVPVATWLFPVFFIRYLRTASNTKQTVLCAVVYISMFFVAWKGLIAFPGIFFYIVAGGIGGVLFLPFLIDRYFAVRINGFASTFVFPLVYTTIEFIGFKFTPFGTWGSLAYTQYGNLPLMQLASVTGIYGLTFVITWFSAVINWTWEQEFNWLKIRKGIVFYSGIMLGIFFLGGVSLVVFSPNSNVVKVAGIISPLLKSLLEKEYEWEGKGDPSLANWQSIFEKNRILADDMFKKSESVANAGARIISWAENMVVLPKSEEVEFLDRAREFVKHDKIYLVMAYAAVLHTDHTRLPQDKMYENKFVVLGPNGDVLAEYRKSILVPGLESLMAIKGNDNGTVIDTPYGRVSALICYDNDFPSMVREKVGSKRVDIHFNPSGDWRDIDPYHTYMTAFRAIENGYSTLRVTKNGLSAAYDYQGRLLASMDYFKTDDLVLITHVPTKGIFTVYSHFGDVFAWLNVLGLLSIMTVVVRNNRKAE